MATSNTPWWATPALAGMFAVIGVAIAQAIALRTERRRRDREDHHRLATPLREASLKYISALASYATYITSLNVGHVLITGQPAKVNDPFWVYGEKSRAVDDAIADLTLTAPAALIAAADKFNDPWEVFNRAAQGVPMTEQVKYTHADEIYNLIAPFRNAVRSHLGLDALPEVSRSSLAAVASEEYRLAGNW
ncbi:hypothetical protein [Streptomyces sp. C10-9-1]|uniref:hypothetical protein n=1 Tax=Streptomyces sp. C10-9-1 TaxID=1859285 RepID=UPI003D725717